MTELLPWPAAAIGIDDPGRRFFLLGHHHHAERAFAHVYGIPASRWAHCTLAALRAQGDDSAPVVVLLPRWQESRLPDDMLAVVRRKGGTLVGWLAFSQLWTEHRENVLAQNLLGENAPTTPTNQPEVE